MDNLDLWLQEHFGYENFKGNFDRTTNLFFKLKNELSQKKSKIITIAGTNGKGETALRLEKILMSEGIKTALWTSPHIISANERYRFDGEEINSEYLLLFFKEVYAENKELKNSSYYEFLFYAFMKEVLKRDIDVIILEVGLGGRLDATNVFDADIMGVTSISRDHQVILGSRYKDILCEKLGIAREGKPLITNFELKYLRELTKMYTQKKNIQWIDLFDDGTSMMSDHYSLRNQKLAQKIASTILNKEVEAALDINLRARCERINTDRGNYFFNGSHNLDGLRKFIDYLKAEGNLKFDKTLVSFSKRDEKEILSMLKMLQKAINCLGDICICDFDHPRALDSKSLMTMCNKTLSIVDNSGRLIEASGVTYIGKNWQKYIAENSYANQEIMVIGSYYFVSKVQQFINN